MNKEILSYFIENQPRVLQRAVEVKSDKFGKESANPTWCVDYWYEVYPLRSDNLDKLRAIPADQSQIRPSFESPAGCGSGPPVLCYLIGMDPGIDNGQV